MVMAFLFVSSWLPFAACFAFSAFLSLAVFDFCAFPPPMFDLKDSYTTIPDSFLLLTFHPDSSLFGSPAKSFHSQSKPTPLSFSNRTHCETPPPLATLLISTSNTAASCPPHPKSPLLAPPHTIYPQITPKNQKKKEENNKKTRKLPSSHTISSDLISKTTRQQN
jgi:hypothetical protein